jgi:uncharacterized lipoprotein
MRLIKLAAIAVLPLYIIGCSYFSSPSSHTRAASFKQAKSIPPLKIPQGISSSSFSSNYPVSNKHYSEAQLNIDLEPPGLYKKKKG